MAQIYLIEARNAGGDLDPAAEQPPFNTASERQLYELYNEHSGRTAYQGEEEHRALVWAWYAGKGWAIRPKTW